ncbi:hypothetical protein Mame01_56010 [Microbispora amethystogenes]|nr:hypothetical protein Mame01_56010 [Microbispora amethystogenes]
MGAAGVLPAMTVTSESELLTSVPKAAVIPFLAVLTQGSVMLSAAGADDGEAAATAETEDVPSEPQAAVAVTAPRLRTTSMTRENMKIPSPG